MPSADAIPEIKVVFPAAEIAKKIDTLAATIAKAGMDNMLVVAILKGSFVFAADLIRALHAAGISPEVDFITLSSYRKSTKSAGTVEILRDVESSIGGRNVLLVDDILESGRTLAFAKDLMVARGARRVMTCVLLDKPGHRGAEVEADFRAFECPDVFVIGYGMDIGHRYRELPFVGALVGR